MLDNSVHLSVYNKVILKVSVKLYLIDNKLRGEHFMTNSILRSDCIKNDKTISIIDLVHSKKSWMADSSQNTEQCCKN